MKNLLILTLGLLIFAPCAFGQDINGTNNLENQSSYEMHFKKHKVNKAAAWVTLGAGVTMAITGYAINTGQGFSDTPDKGVGLAYAGGAIALLSTPFFIASGKHKRKAEIALKNQSVSFGNMRQNKSNYMSLSIAIPF